jgi:alpha-maltose-1-phosphate synthase
MCPNLHVAHVLRKYNPAEWGGTETAVMRLLDGLRVHGVKSTVFCPRLDPEPGSDPIAGAGHSLKRFHAFVPVAGISAEQKQQLVAVGGNLMSFGLLPALLKARDISLIHTHAGNRLGGIAMRAAGLRKVPLVATIHGGVLDLPESAREFLQKPLEGGVEWGKVFGLLVGARKVLEQADAILTCNKREAQLQQQKFPGKRVVVQPHSVPAAHFAEDCREPAWMAFPQLKDRDFLLTVGRIDPVKNQDWLVARMPQLLTRHPELKLVLAGSCTDPGYGKKVEKQIQALGLGQRVLLTGGLPPSDPRLRGLLQLARAVVVPSLSETFGLVILEAWAAGTPVISSKTSGAKDLIRDGENGWLLCAVDMMLQKPDLARRMAAQGRELVCGHFDVAAVGGQVKKLYEELINEKR